MSDQPKVIQIKLGDSVANRVHQVLTAIGRPDAAAAASSNISASPTVSSSSSSSSSSAVNLVATGSGCQKLFSIVEIAKRRLKSDNLIYHQYNRLTGEKVEIKSSSSTTDDEETQHPALAVRRFKTMPKLEIWLSLEPLAEIGQNTNWTYQSSAK